MARVIARHADPIRVRSGDTVRVGRRDDQYPSFAWCEAADGRTGWVPLAILTPGGGESATAAHDYSAAEIDVSPGDLSGYWSAPADGPWWTPGTALRAGFPMRCSMTCPREMPRLISPACSPS